MRNRNEIIKSLNDELNKNSISNYSKLIPTIYEEFKVFFINKDNLKFALEHGVFIYDYMFYLNNFKDSVFEGFLCTLVSCFRDAKEADEIKCKEFINEWKSHISSGVENMAQISYLEEDKNKIDRLDLFAKTSFRDLGDMIEGTIKQYVKFFYGCYLIITERNVNILDKVNKSSLGECISILSNYNDDFKILYKYCFLEVSLNQWRNIANHNSYLVIEETNKIKASYGMKNKNEILITRDELSKILVTANAIGYLHKIAYTIIMADNLDMLKDDKKNSEYYKDTIIAQIIESSFTYGFSIISFNELENEWIFEVKYKGKTIEKKDHNVKQLVSIVSRLILKSTSLFISTINDSQKVEIKLQPFTSKSRTLVCEWRPV